jgi:carboxypeptidase family protein
MGDMARSMIRSIALVASLLIPCAVAAQERVLGPAGTVTISRPDYDRLIDLAGKQPRAPELPPLPAALTRTDIRARVDSGVVRATMLVEGEVFRTGTVKVPLVAGATLLEARMADRSLPLVAESGTHFAVLTGPSAFSLTLEWGTSLTTTPGRGSFTMPVPASGSATATIDVPGEQTDVHVNPGLVVRRATLTTGRTIAEVTLDPGSPAQVWWSTRETAPTAPAREARMLSSVKTLVTIGEADLRLVTLLDLTIVQGEPSEFEVRIPAGFEVAGVTGASLERTEERSDRVVLLVRNPAQRRHQFLVNLERPHGGGSMKLATGFPTVPSAQRETGEVALEGIGALDVSAPEVPGLRRMDVREIDPVLASAARRSLLAAYRYQRGAGPDPVLALDVTRFANASVLAAVAERAVATTLVTSEGRALTEVSLWVRNRAQSFIKVALPPGASMVSVEVAGEPAKPVEGRDGTRVPLLRPGFRPDGPYSVSFVYLHAGAPFDKKGDKQMTLPKMDLPVNIVEWELFVPDRYRADRFDGNAIAADLVSIHADGVSSGAGPGYGSDATGPLNASTGQIVGRVVDAAGAAVPGVAVTASGSGGTQSTVTDARGVYAFSNVPSGPIAVTGQLPGFQTAQRSFVFDQRPRQADLTLQAGALAETINVAADAPIINTHTSDRILRREEAKPQAQSNLDQVSQLPSVNVQSLQRRAAGVLPVRVEIPRAGTSHRFVKPLVIDEETIVSFRYKRR